MRARLMQFFHCSDYTREWKQQVENLGFRKADAVTKQEPKGWFWFWCVFTMRELISAETQQIADCTLLPSNPSYSC